MTDDSPDPAPDAGNLSARLARLGEIEAKAEFVHGRVTSFVDSAEAAATAAAESQVAVAATLSEARAKLSEITDLATQATAVRTQCSEESIALINAAKATANTTTETQAAAAAAFADAQNKIAEIANTATAAVSAKTQIADEQGIIAAKSAHIQAAQEHADTVRTNLDRALTAATQSATEVEGFKARSQTAADSATTLLGEIRTAKGSVDAEALAATESRQGAEAAAAIAKGLADKSTTIEQRVTGYEERLGDLLTASESRLKQIEELLRGATSVGLAHAFDARRKTFLRPYIWWQCLFIGALLVLVAVACHGLYTVYHFQTAPQWDELVRMWLSRLPLVGALVWLAIHAGREAALTKRLEEDYGYKSVVASCFEGFRKEMAAIGKDVAADSALGKLCADTLTTMATPPGRIYEKHALTVTPLDEIKQLAKALKETTTATLEASKPILEAAAKMGKVG